MIKFFCLINQRMANCCPPGDLKLTKATVVKYNLNDTKNKPDKSCCRPQIPPQSLSQSYNKPVNLLEKQEEATEFQNRVGKLKNKLAEANTNISLLRAWVGETLNQVSGVKPKSSKEIVEELKELLVSLDDFEDENYTITQRGMDCMKMLDDLESKSCICGLTSPSAEEIKKQLQQITKEKEELEEALKELQNGSNNEEGRQLVAEDLANAAKAELNDLQSCTDATCSKRTANPSIREHSRSKVGTGIQYNAPKPETRPKILQTDAKTKYSQGTGPCCGISCSKGSNTRALVRCKK